MSDFSHLVPSFEHIVDRQCSLQWQVVPAPKSTHNIMFVTGGEGICKTAGGEFPLARGSFVYHSPGEISGYDTSKTSLMRVFGINLHLTALYFENGLWEVRPYGRLPLPEKMEIQDVGALQALFNRLTEIWTEKSPLTTLQCRSVFMEILCVLSKQAASLGEPPETVLCIDRLASFIYRNYNRPLTLEDLAKFTGFNPGYLVRTFKKHKGLTPMEYLHRIRMRRAEEYLRSGYNVSETAKMVGYEDAFYFSRMFKKSGGSSPREYIQKYRTGETI
ncbi:MAG TPA: hypothetical protein DD727_09290 [Clostridiales bacterium]|nr:hypothetical protein [Clostridiales bacterium]